tara:strand:- start:1046 stop:1222 length:177 start_codon:yes stop_codon:yes gene_type:complete
MTNIEEAVAILMEAGVFHIKNGSAELHFDSLGRLSSVDIHQKAFRRGTISTLTIVKNP